MSQAAPPWIIKGAHCLIGGAAINRRFGRRTLFVEGERAYDPGVFYCKDAFEGLETVDTLMDPPARQALVRRILDEARSDVFLHATTGKDALGGSTATVDQWKRILARDIARRKLSCACSANGYAAGTCVYRSMREP